MLTKLSRVLTDDFTVDKDFPGRRDFLFRGETGGMFWLIVLSIKTSIFSDAVVASHVVSGTLVCIESLSVTSTLPVLVDRIAAAVWGLSVTTNDDSGASDEFWKSVNKINQSSQLHTTTIDGITGEANIAEHWRTHFHGILNTNICDQTLKSFILAIYT